MGQRGGNVGSLCISGCTWKLKYVGSARASAVRMRCPATALVPNADWCVNSLPAFDQQEIPNPACGLSLEGRADARFLGVHEAGNGELLSDAAPARLHCSHQSYALATLYYKRRDLGSRCVAGSNRQAWPRASRDSEQGGD